jgi:hypothetical protein
LLWSTWFWYWYNQNLTISRCVHQLHENDTCHISQTLNCRNSWTPCKVFQFDFTWWATLKQHIFFKHLAWCLLYDWQGNQRTSCKCYFVTMKLIFCNKLYIKYVKNIKNILRPLEIFQNRLDIFYRALKIFTCLRG